jgi:predicted RNA-binding Zn ribbon-like protein
MSSVVPAAPIYESGFGSLERDLAEIRRRIARGRPRPDDLDDLDALTEALAELRALYRADLRVALELGDEATPLDVALLHAEELLHDSLTLRTIPFETREALRATREADWSVVLYGLAGAARTGASTNAGDEAGGR